MEAWDVVVIGDGPAALRSAATAAKHGAKTLMMSANALGSGDSVAAEGIAAPIHELNNKGHREDTIVAGDYLSDQDIVALKTSQAVEILDGLEKSGVVFSRDAKGLPRAHKGIGHNSPRVIDAGDATIRDVQQVLEEQCMKYGVVRRADQLPVTLVHTKSKVDGLIAVDMVNGQFIAVQAKAVIIADGGFEGLFNNSAVSHGLDIALQAGIPLRNMEFIVKSPTGVANSRMTIPTSMLGYGAQLCDTSGNSVVAETILATSSILEEGTQVVLDARSMEDDKSWWNGVIRKVKQATQIDMEKYTIGVENRVEMTIGGIPVDEHGRAVIGAWSRWFTGLYAAGDSSCSGLHGAGILPGNRLLDAISGGKSAGEHAANWSKGAKLTNADNIFANLKECKERYAAQFSDEEVESVQRIGALQSQINNVANLYVSGANSADDLAGYLTSLSELQTEAETIHLDQKSLIANTNLIAKNNSLASIRLLRCSIISAQSRNESRGSHVRSDFPDHDDELLHHITVDKDDNVGTLALRKGAMGNWLLAPQ